MYMENTYTVSFFGHLAVSSYRETVKFDNGF